MNDELLADEIRRRERARRRKGPMWTVCSFILHVVLFGAIILFTPAKSLIFEPKDNSKDAAKDLSADRIEEIGDTLSDVRINELLEQILALQAVLHNMDMMKQELAKSYDSFAEKSGATAKEELQAFISELEQNQVESTNAQQIVRAEIAALVAAEKKDYKQDAVFNEIREKSGKLLTQTIEKTNTAQGNAVNALDKLQVRAEFVGYQKTAEAAAKFLEAQAETARMQNEVQTASTDIADGLANVYYNEKWGVPGAQGNVNHSKKRREELAKQKTELTQKVAEIKAKEAVEIPKINAEVADLKAKREKAQADLAAVKEQNAKELAAADAEIEELKKKLEALK